VTNQRLPRSPFDYFITPPNLMLETRLNPTPVPARVNQHLDWYLHLLREAF
jgi:hypothetical protein